MKTKIQNEVAFEGKTAVELAIRSFIIETLFFILSVLSNQNSDIIILGSLFGFGVVFLNIIMLFYLFNNLIKLPNQRHYITSRILILLINIPISYLYYLIIFKINY